MTKVCCVCEQDGSPYKCPICRVPYCSIKCCKTHKESNCSSVGTQPKPAEHCEGTAVPDQVKYNFPTEDTVPVQKLHELRNSKELKECLKNPHVRDIMQAIINDKDPTKAIALAMTEPIFVELADACLKVVEPPDTDIPS